MSIKLDSKYIKNKLKAKYAELEVYNAIDKNIYAELAEMIKSNSSNVELENGMSDIKIDNTILIMRYMLKNLTNIEDNEYWDSVNDNDLEEILNLANGDFKSVVNSLLDIMLEIAQDIRLEEIRKLDMISNKIEELTKVFEFNQDMDVKLKEFGIDRELLAKIQDGDKEAIEQFQNALIEKAKKPQRNKKSKSK